MIFYTCDYKLGVMAASHASMRVSVLSSSLLSSLSSFLLFSNHGAKLERKNKVRNT